MTDSWGLNVILVFKGISSSEKYTRVRTFILIKIDDLEMEYYKFSHFNEALISSLEIDICCNQLN